MGEGNSDGGWTKYYLSDDSATFTDKSSTKKVGIGMYAIEISDDNIKWQIYRTLSYGSEKDTDLWEIDKDLLSKGVYVRISYMFEIYARWTVSVWKTEWYNHLLFGIPIGGHYETETRTGNYQNIREMSDSFYVCVNGFGDTDLGVMKIHNLSVEDSILPSADGFSAQGVKKIRNLKGRGVNNNRF